jgi:hypothetical protein
MCSQSDGSQLGTTRSKHSTTPGAVYLTVKAATTTWHGKVSHAGCFTACQDPTVQQANFYSRQPSPQTLHDSKAHTSSA